MDADKLFGKVLKMISFAISDRGAVKKKVNKNIRGMANGRAPEKLTGPERWALGSFDEDYGLADHVMPRDICRLLGFKLGATYGDLVMAPPPGWVPSTKARATVLAVQS
jgi:hypothetical protein